MLKYKYILAYVLIFFHLSTYSQVDEIKINFIIGGRGKRIQTKQEFIVTPFKKKIRLYAWANAYQPDSDLSEKLLRERNDKLYFSEKKDRGEIKNLSFFDEQNSPIPYRYLDNEVIEIQAPSDAPFRFKAKYELIVPSDIYTSYGVNKNGNIFLKYFFLQPAKYNSDEYTLQSFKNLETLVANNTNYTIQFTPPKGTTVFTNLNKIGDNTYEGKNRTFFDIAILKNGLYKTFKTSHTDITLGVHIDSCDFPLVNQSFERQLNFLDNFFPPIKEPIFASSKINKNLNYKFVDDVNIPLFGKYKIFSKKTRIELKILPILFETYCDRKVHINGEKNHWIKNGLSTYLQIRYLEKYFHNLPIAGNLLEDLHLYNFYPLDLFQASKVNFKDRFSLHYKYILQKNHDQPLSTPYDSLSIQNQKIVSHYKSALAFKYLEDYIGQPKMDSILKGFFHEKSNTFFDEKNLQDYFESKTNTNLDWFFHDLVTTPKKIDYSIANIQERKGFKIINIDNHSNFSGPLKLYGYDKNGKKTFEKWYKTDKKNTNIYIPKDSSIFFSINEDSFLPDFNRNDNFYNTETVFNRKTRFGIGSDIHTPEKQQYFLTPNLNFNNYDKLQLGVKISNKTLLKQAFEFEIEPRYSFGAKKLTGNTKTSYSIFPDQGFIRSMNFGSGIQYGHYNKGLAFFNYHIGSSIVFRTSAKNLNQHRLSSFFSDFNRQIPQNATPIEVELKRYNILNIGYDYWNFHILHENKANLFIQISNKFKKIFGEYYYRYKFSPNKRLGIRFFGGVFLNHELKKTTFYDYGLDHISDYMYRYNLLGRSEQTGFFHQQYVRAEGGFKSNFNIKSNEFLSSVNLEFPIWKALETYADFAIYKNKANPAYFVYDTGLSLKLIPDFLEFHFPIQSSLGFEPQMGNYLERIRFTFVFNLNEIKEYREKFR